MTLEEERIVEWLREEAIAQRRRGWSEEFDLGRRLEFEVDSRFCEKLAQAIEHGHHRKDGV